MQSLNTIGTGYSIKNVSKFFFMHGDGYFYMNFFLKAGIARIDEKVGYYKEYRDSNKKWCIYSIAPNSPSKSEWQTAGLKF